MTFLRALRPLALARVGAPHARARRSVSTGSAATASDANRSRRETDPRPGAGQVETDVIGTR